MLASGARADPAPEIDPARGTLSEMQTGRLLIEAGRLEHAHRFLERARPSDEEEQIERLFLLGRIEIRLGQPARAAERFEAILARRPDLTRVRLELAQAYFLAGRDDKARYHFDHTLADELPSSVEGAVEGFLRRIDARKRWSMSLSASLLPEVSRPDRDTILIGGIPFRLSEEARASSGAGLQVLAGASLSPAIGDDLHGVLAASAGGKFYRRSDWNDVTGSADVGLARLLGPATVSGGLRFGRRWLGGDGHQRSLGPWARSRMRLSRSVQLDVALSAGYQSHDTRRDRDGWRVSLNPRFLYLPDGRTSIEAEPVFETAGARKDFHGSRLLGLRMTVARAFAGGLSVSISSSAHFRRHKARDPLFGRKQRDRTTRLGVRVLHRSLAYNGFAPYVGYSVERNRSNIPVREYRNDGLMVGVSRRF